MTAKRTSRLSATPVRAAAKRASTRRSKPSTRPDSESDASYSNNDDEAADPTLLETQPAKRRKTNAAGTRSSRINAIHQQLFLGKDAIQVDARPCSLPTRPHLVTYHRPRLLYGQEGRNGRDKFLQWFDSKSTARAMPWRKPWIDPSSIPDDASALRSALERRAYEVWISEIMLQQTRVAVVIDYWKRWMAKWPTIQDLAASEHSDVLAMWQGLGYYSRATRIHEAAKLVVADAGMRGLLPEAVDELVAKVPGVGRYTAGAISSIVFGRAAPMVDGNVLRVLSRQLGIYGNVKTDKAVIDTLWAAADALVKAVALESDDHRPGDSDHVQKSDRPGRWGQGLMELGSTVCTPKPNCSECPITSTCRTYIEGQAAASSSSSSSSKATAPTVDIEDLCTLCEPFEEVADGDETDNPAKDVKPVAPIKAKQSTLASFAFTRQSTKTTDKVHSKPDVPDVPWEAIANHARKFPVKVVKKAVREEATLVCAIRCRDGRYLVHRRPDKGLLAGLWEFPSHSLGSTKDKAATTAGERRRLARTFVTRTLREDRLGEVEFDQVGEVGEVPWVFSHLKLTMYVHLFTVSRGSGADDAEAEDVDGQRWSDDVDKESMGTGMRKCWALVRDAVGL